MFTLRNLESFTVYINESVFSTKMLNVKQNQKLKCSKLTVSVIQIKSTIIILNISVNERVVIVVSRITVKSIILIHFNSLLW